MLSVTHLEAGPSEPSAPCQPWLQELVGSTTSPTPSGHAKGGSTSPATGMPYQSRGFQAGSPRV
ncbi:hypothetical protein DAEQUDRAFT_724336, partial [Daedalea quercina L-15889]